MKNLNRNRYFTKDQREKYMDMANACFNFMTFLAKFELADKTDGIKPDGSISGKLIERTDNLVYKCLLS